ncbi:amino acid racemase [archaeon]|nr:amino acid racemase [archaeon]
MEKDEMKIVGIVGGVGPEASNKFCELLIKNTPARKDQDNIPFLHFCNPQIPDRTDYIVGVGEDPVGELIETSRALENAGADFLVIPCNTAHYFLSQVQEEVSVPIVDMTKVLVKSVLSKCPPIRKIGLLATTGSIRGEIYQDYFSSVGVEVVLLDDEDQEKLVMDAIYGENGVKAGKKNFPRKKLKEAVDKLVDMGAEAIVLGCTEIPLVLNQKDFDVKLYDPMDLTAKEIVNYVCGDVNNDFVSVEFVLEDFARSVGRVLSEGAVGVEVVSG